MKQQQKIRLVRAPKLKLFAPAHIVDGFEIKWDTRIQAWEMATPDPRMYSFRIGRVVNGKTFITEMVNDTEPATGDLSDRAHRALTKLGNQGVDLGEWEQGNPPVEEEVSGTENHVVLLTPKAVAERLSVTPQMLATWRHRKVGPKWLKVGRLVRYDSEVFERWLVDGGDTKTPVESHSIPQAQEKP